MKLQALIAEFIGVFALCFIGVTAIHNMSSLPPEFGGLGLVGIALAHGLTIAVMIGAFGHISGGHFNPAITLAMMVTRNICPKLGIGYILVQFVGGIAGGGFAGWLIGVGNVLGGTPQIVRPEVTPMHGMVAEMVMTFFLVIVVFGAAVSKRGPNVVAGLFIGLTITACILAGGPITGAALNPARWLGAATVAMFFEGTWWVYIAGPFLGGLLAAALHMFMKKQDIDPPVVEEAIVPEQG